MLSDEEKKAINDIKRELTDEDRREYMNKWFADDLQALINLIEKQFKEIEELKEKNKNMIDPSKARLSYYDGGKGTQVVLEGFISKEESEQKEKEAYIKGTNVADELCNKKWEDKIKAKIEELKQKKYILSSRESEIEILQSLLEEKE